jgi:hypothetical protein
MNKVSLLAKLCCVYVLLALSLNVVQVNFRGTIERSRATVGDGACMPIPECLDPGGGLR